MAHVVVRVALVLLGLLAWAAIVAGSVRMGRRRRETGHQGWPCVAGGGIVGLIVCYFIATFAAM